MSTRSQMTVIALAAALVLALGGNVVESHHKCGHGDFDDGTCGDPPPDPGGGGGLCVTGNEPANVPLGFTLVERLRLPKLIDPDVKAIELGRALAGRQMTDFNGSGPVTVNGIVNPIVFATRTLNQGPHDTPTLRFYLLDPLVTPPTPPVPITRNTADLDGDGAADFVVISEVVSPSLEHLPRLLDADFNGDGVPDFVASDAAAGGVEVYLGHFTEIPNESNKGTLTYGVPNGDSIIGPDVVIDTMGAFRFGSAVAVGNIDGDVNGRDELAIGAEGGGKGKTATHGKVFIYDNNFGVPQKIDSADLLGFTTDDRFGSSVAFGEVDGVGTPTILDLIVGARGHKKGAGAVFVFSGNGNGTFLVPPLPFLLTEGGAKDHLGFAVAAALNTTTAVHDVVASTDFRGDDVRAEVFLHPIPNGRATLRPTFGAGGWTRGISTGDIGDDGRAEVLINAQTTSCEGGRGHQGLAYLYFVVDDPAVDVDTPAPLVFQPDADVDPTDMNRFGSAAVIITTEIPADSPTKGASFVFIGEFGREDPLRGLGNDGQIYIYKTP